MEHLGFMHTIFDVKVLILYVMGLVETPVSAQTVYELCYQDDSLSYFDVQESIPQMVESGHLELQDAGYVITEKGRGAGEVTWDAIAYPVRERARAAVEQFNRSRRLEKFLHTEVTEREDGSCLVRMALDNPDGQLMDLTLQTKDLVEARRLVKGYRRNAELVYKAVMIGILGEDYEAETENL